MIKAVKIRLFPTEEQEVIMRKSIGIARFTYNWGLNRWNDMYKEGLKPSKDKIRKEFNNTIKTQEEFAWLYDVSAKVTAQAFEDLDAAFQNFFNKRAERPTFKSKRKSRMSFYVRYDAIKFVNGTVNMERIGKVKYKSNYDIPKLPQYVNPRCSFDGKYWYLSLGFEHGEIQTVLRDCSIGIDLGIKQLAVCSDGKKVKNINKSKRVRTLEKKLKRLQRQCSRKYEMNKQGNTFIKTKNIIKAEEQLKLLHLKLTNIRQNHIHQATNAIIQKAPKRVVMEDLNVSGMMKNKHLAKAIAGQKLKEFIRQMKYKCKFNGIEFVQVGRWYPSSKMCSSCGNIKKDLKLSDRTYICQECGLVLDRDYNASINLEHYQSA